MHLPYLVFIFVSLPQQGIRKDVQRVAEQEDLINVQYNNSKALLQEVAQLVVRLWCRVTFLLISSPAVFFC